MQIEDLNGIKVVSSSEIMEREENYKRKKVTLSLIYNGEKISDETLIYEESSFWYADDSEPGVFVGIGVERDVCISINEVYKDPGYEDLKRIKEDLENLERNRKRFAIFKENMERAIERLKENKELFEFIKEHAETFIRIGKLGDFYFVRDFYVERGIIYCRNIPTFTLTEYFEREYHDISEFSDLPYAERIIEEGINQSFIYDLVEWVQ